MGIVEQLSMGQFSILQFCILQVKIQLLLSFRVNVAPKRIDPKQAVPPRHPVGRVVGVFGRVHDHDGDAAALHFAGQLGPAGAAVDIGPAMDTSFMSMARR